tara:strand:+ start:35547 stop:38135 length:2589 start_codon:yes stop_codon:yes gene_type:complete
MKYTVKYTKTFFLLIVISFFFACSTQKKTYIHKKYHNITARYNGYFNGKESLKYGIKKLEQSHKEDYTIILPVFKHNEILTSKSHHSYMDKTIKKGSKVIQNHSINIRNKEYCKWIDDSYLLVAKGYYFKGQFLEAKNTFDFIISKFKKTNPFWESQLWKAKCFIKLNDFNSAENILDNLESKNKFPEKFTKDLHLIYADLYLNQENFLDAVDELKSAINLIKKNREKARYYYIIAQIYQEFGNINQSSLYYKKVLSSNSDYEMVFNAKMNLARTLRNKKDLIQMRESLLRMIKDEKNKEYLDQIYFTLAEMNIVENDTLKAITNYKLSTKHSVNNDLQKSLSFLQLAKIYYNQSKHIKSKIFYDSTITFMDENHYLFQETKKTHNILSELSVHLEIINLEDSLQWIASLPESERKLIIKSIIDLVIEKEQEEIRSQQNSGNRFLQNRNNNQNFGNNTSGGKWYFYNPATLSFGLSEFRKKWGKRKLEDDWRRSNKKSINNTETDSLSLNKESEQKNLKSEQYYLDQLPLSNEDLKLSNDRILNSLYESSIIYKEDLKNLKNSENMLINLVERFPKNIELTPFAYYLLYNLQIEKKQIQKANKTKQTLINKYPETNYARYLNDTNYIKAYVLQEEYKQKQYQEIYNLYILDSLLLSKEKSSYQTKVLHPELDKEYISKYFLIKILSTFRLEKDTTLFITKLEEGKKRFEDVDIGYRFEELLLLISNTSNLEERNLTALLKTPYRFDKNSAHYLLLILPKENTDISFIKTLVSDFNNQNYSSKVFEFNSMMLGLDNHLLLIKTFNNYNNVLNYSKLLLKDVSIQKELNKSEYMNIIISKENFNEFYKNKDIEGYNRFFNNNYL